MVLALVVALIQAVVPVRLDRGRFTVVYYPQDARLAATLAGQAVRTDTFPGLPRPTEHVLIAIASDEARFRAWVGPGAPEWGAAISFPASHRVIMQGRGAGADAGDPRAVLRHELAHLALHEYLGDNIPRWFDEGYATYTAHEWEREDVLAANVALAVRGVPTFDQLDHDLIGGCVAGRGGLRAVVSRRGGSGGDCTRPRARDALRELAETGSLDRAVRATFGMTLGGYEHEWQQSTRRRYGGLALFGNLAFVGLLMSFLLVPLYLARRRRDRDAVCRACHRRPDCRTRSARMGRPRY